MSRPMTRTLIQGVALLSIAVAALSSAPGRAAEPMQAMREALRAGGVVEDARLATKAVAARLMGDNPARIANRLGASGTEAVKTLAAFMRPGMRPVQAWVTKYEAGAEAGSRELGMVVEFRDPIGRRAVASFSAAYRFAKDRVDFDALSWKPLFAPRPEVEMMIVPLPAVEAALAAARPSYAELYDLAKRHDLRSVEGAKPKGRSGYVVFAFFKDLLAPGARIKLDVARSRKGYKRDSRQTRYLSEDGFGLAVIAGTFAINRAKKYYFRVRFRPGGDAEDRDWRRLAYITNRL